MTVADACTRDVSTANPNETVRDAARRMYQESVGTLVIVDDRSGQPRAIGIVTDRDLVTRALAADLDVRETPLAMVMSVPVQSVGEDRPLKEALERMSRRSIRRLAVTDSSGVLVGVLALDDVLEALVDDAGRVGRVVAGSAPTHG